MKKTRFWEHGSVAAPALVASVVIAVLSLLGFLVVPLTPERPADLYLEPATGRAVVGETFTLQVFARSLKPVNVFAGELIFDPEHIVVDAIDYNISIADLWAEKPWYENGAGTINFVGGTTRSGGFVGDETLITITFRTVATGDARITIRNSRILAHDGLGTEVPLAYPLDALFGVLPEVPESQTTLAVEQVTKIIILNERARTDLNGDGKQSLADVSIFMQGLFSNDLRFDFNNDGKVNTKDLSILMSAE